MSRGKEAVVGGFMLLVLALFVLGIGAPVALAVARGVARVGAEA